MKKALIVGIDDYPQDPLEGCVNDAKKISSLLEKNGDASPNFEINLKISSECNVNSETLDTCIKNLFQYSAEMVLFYFAGHGYIDANKKEGYLVAQDGQNPHWGVSFSHLINLANKAYPKIKSTIIILDSCHSGSMGEISGLGNTNISHVGTGVTILTACHKSGIAEEKNGHGKFTDIMIDALNGASSDILGRITPASLYSYVDQTLGAFEQRPIYKANVENFITLRTVEPKVPKEILRKLPKYFPSKSHIFKLNPSYEPDRGEKHEELKSVEVIESNVEIYRELQKCCNNGLVVPSEHEHMWHSAVNYGGCRLTATGIHYRYLATKNKI